MSADGFGLCGHKNAFSTGVKVGNFVEDRIGSELVRTSQPQCIADQSEASASFIDPKLMLDRSGHAPADNPSERFLVRAGLPYSLVFEHGTAHLPTTSELTHKYTPSSTAIGRNVPARPSTLHEDARLQQQLALKRSRDARELRHNFVTTAQSALPSTSLHFKLT